MYPKYGDYLLASKVWYTDFRAETHPHSPENVISNGCSLRHKCKAPRLYCLHWLGLWQEYETLLLVNIEATGFLSIINTAGMITHGFRFYLYLPYLNLGPIDLNSDTNIKRYSIVQISDPLLQPLREKPWPRQLFFFSRMILQLIVAPFGWMVILSTLPSPHEYADNSR